MCFSRHKLTCRVTAFISLLLGRLPEDRYKAQYSGEVLGPPGPGLGRDLVWDRDRPKLQEIDFLQKQLILLHMALSQRVLKKRNLELEQELEKERREKKVCETAHGYRQAIWACPRGAPGCKC